MKFQIIPYALLSTLSFHHANAAEIITMSIPQCIKFEPINMVGDATFVGANPGAPAIGDMTIGKYEGVPKINEGAEQEFANKGVPEQPGGFTDIDLTFDSECVVTTTQGAPTCSYLFKMFFCREKNIKENDCRLGYFSAYGKGPQKIEITGGTDDFVGAFGEITTTTDFDQGTPDPATGNLQDSEVDMRVTLCYHEDAGQRKIFDVYSRVQATDFDTQKGIRIAQGGAWIGYFKSGDYVGYKEINFGSSGSTKSILLRYAKGNTTGGTVEFRTGGPTGTLIGQIGPIQNTGTWKTFTTVKIVLTNQAVEGLNDLYFVCSGASTKSCFNLEWFELSQLGD